MHSLIELGAVEASQFYEKILSTLNMYGLLPGEPIKHFASAEAEELYHSGERLTGRLIWGWLRRSDVGILVKVVYQLKRDFLFVAYLDEQNKWVIGNQLSSFDSLSMLRNRIKHVDREGLDSVNAAMVVEVMAQTFKETLRIRQRFAC